jgi:hypothetical protein
MPDIENDPQVSNHWPQNLDLYNREKKLIRDVSHGNTGGKASKPSLGMYATQKSPFYQVRRVGNFERTRLSDQSKLVSKLQNTQPVNQS